MVTTRQTSITLFEKRATEHGQYAVSRASKSSLLHYLRGCATTQFKTADDHMEWWQKHNELRAFLSRLDPKAFAKVAAIGGDQEQGFEQAFSSLAYAYLKDKAPRLIDFIVGFQLVDRNEDNTKAVGIFGFKVGHQWLYAPIFFLNGDLKGHELLYIKNEDMFVPMKENWVNYLISKRPHVLGEGSAQNTHQLGGLMPNLYRLTYPPTGTKFSSDVPLAITFAEWSMPFLPFVCAAATKKASALYHKQAGDLDFKAVVERPFAAALAPVASKFDLRVALADFPLLKAAFELGYLRYPLIKKGFDQFYGTSFFAEMAKIERDRVDSLVKRAEDYRPKPKIKPSMSTPAIMPEAPVRDKNAGLYIYSADRGASKNKIDEDGEGGFKENLPELDDDERETLLHDTILIKDKRDSHGVSEVYNTQVHLELINPSDTGLHLILEKPGSFDEMVVISSPHSGRGREDFSLVLRKSAPRNWRNLDRSRLWAKTSKCPTPQDWKDYVEKLPGLDELKKGGTYVAVHQNGSGTCAFRVLEAYDNGGYSVSWEDHCPYSDRRIGHNKWNRPQDYDFDYSPWRAKIYVNKRKGSGLKSVNGELSIPDSYKVIKIADPPKPKKRKETDLVGMCSPAMSCYSGGSGGCDNEDGSEAKPIQPGNLVDVQLAITKQASTIKLHDTGTKVLIKCQGYSQELTKKAALISLVRDHGLREAQARDMLKDAATRSRDHRGVEYFIKYADGFGGGNLFPGPGAPAFPEPQTGSEPMGYSSVPSIYPQEEQLPVPGMDSGMSDPSVYDPFYQPDPQAMQQAQQASQSGQKEVFDTTMIGNMLKSVRQDSLVDKHLGDLMKALSALGKIMFMFFWHQEDFQDRYGKQDLPELEDSLRNSFEALGDLTLFLKEKQVGGGPGTLNSAGVGSPDEGEPSVQEAAKN